LPYLIVTAIPLENAALRQELRPAHLAFLDENVAVILAAGAKLDDEPTKPGGSFYLVDYEELGDAQRFIDNDPYVKGGAVSDIQLTRVRKGYFDRARVEASK
jgi:uncharacterized protein